MSFVSPPRYVNESEVRNMLGHFQGQTVAVGLKVMEGALPLAEGKVTTLETMPVNAMDFTSAGLELSRPAQKIPEGVLAGRLLQKLTPVYPESARRRGIQGNVVLHVTIGTDGHVRQLAVLATPDPDLAIASVSAVRHWVYTPYLLNGTPAEVDTTVTVQFNFAGVPPRSR